MIGTRSNAAGFTLLELMIALVVFGLLLVVLTQGIHFGLLTWRMEARLTAASGDLYHIDSTLRRLIEAIDPGSDNSDQPTFYAGRDTMSFVTDLPDPTDVGRTRRVRATLLVNQRRVLVLRWQPMSASGLSGSPPWSETEIMHGVSRMDLAFRGRGGGWIADWRSVGLPAMVRIHLVFADGSTRPWPDIVVAPLLDPM